MRIGLVGAGRIGAFHAETLAGRHEVDQLVINDLDESRARTVSDKVGGVVAVELDDLLASVDGVVIATSTAAHAELVRRAAAAGVAVFCEKPLASDIAGTRAVLADVAAAGVPLQIGFQRRFDAGYTVVREAVRSGRLGWLHTLRACTADPAPPSAAYLATSGGIFRDCAVHDFDVIRWVTGREVESVYALGTNRYGDDPRVDGDLDTALAMLTLDDGALAVCSATRYNGAGYDVRLEACGSVSTLVAGLDDHAPLTSAEGAAWPAGQSCGGFLERFRDAYVGELIAFCEVVTGVRESPCDGADALEALLVAEAAERSRIERRPVSLAEIRGGQAGR